MSSSMVIGALQCNYRQTDTTVMKYVLSFTLPLLRVMSVCWLCAINPRQHSVVFCSCRYRTTTCIDLFCKYTRKVPYTMTKCSTGTFQYLPIPACITVPSLSSTCQFRRCFLLYWWIPYLHFPVPAISTVSFCTVNFLYRIFQYLPFQSTLQHCIQQAECQT